MACSPEDVLEKARIARRVRKDKTSAEIMEEEIDLHLLAEAIRTGKAYAEFAIPYHMQYTAPEIQHAKEVFTQRGWHVGFGGNPREGHYFIFSQGKAHKVDPESTVKEEGFQGVPI